MSPVRIREATDADEKRTLWGELKVLAWTRCAAVHYAMALLPLLLLLQGNIVAARLSDSRPPHKRTASRTNGGHGAGDVNPDSQPESEQVDAAEDSSAELVALIERFCGEGELRVGSE